MKYGIRPIAETSLRSAALLGLCGLVLGGCVSQGKYDQLARERNALAGQKQSLEQAIAEKQSRLASTSGELESMKAAVAEKEALVAEQQLKLAMASEQLDSMRAKETNHEAMFARLTRELSRELESRQLNIRQMKNGISVDLPEEVLFSPGSAGLRQSGREVLTKVSEQLRDVEYQIIVSGFTDNKPVSGKLARRFPSNWDLAAARATSVVRFLQEKNVPAGNLVAASYGENNAVAANDTVEGRQKNRRLEIHLRPVVQE